MKWLLKWLFPSPFEPPAYRKCLLCRKDIPVMEMSQDYSWYRCKDCHRNFGYCKDRLFAILESRF